MRRNWLEWAVLIASAVSILALVSYLAVLSITATAPAELMISGRPTEARQTDSGWLLPVSVRNTGGEAAAAVTIEASASVSGQPETAEVVVDLLAPGTEAELVVAFSAVPDGLVTFRLIGYQSP